LVFVGMLIATALVRSSAGEVLVLHQHGLSPAHLHVLSYADFLHGPGSKTPPPGALAHLGSASPLTEVLLLAVVVTDPASTPEKQIGGEFDVPSILHSSGLLSCALNEKRMANLAGPIAQPSARTDSSAILLRKHTLLL
jgi:hypothetical protein